MIACPTCQKPGRVVETRTSSLTENAARRTYRCPSGHVFRTQELTEADHGRLLKAAAFFDQLKELVRA